MSLELFNIRNGSNKSDWNWSEDAIKFINPGFAGLGDILKFFEGQLIAVLGSSMAGKSTFLFQLFLHQAKVNNRKYLIYSPEKDVDENARELRRMAGGYEEFIQDHFVFIEPKNGIVDFEELLEAYQEILSTGEVTDVLIDPMNSLFNENLEMLSYSERIPLMVRFKEMAKKYKQTFWFTEHAKTRQKYQGEWVGGTEAEDFVSGREIHNKVDAFITLSRVFKKIEQTEVDTGVKLDAKRIPTNIVEIGNIKTKYATKYKTGSIVACYNPITNRYQFGDQVEWSEFDRRYIMRGNPVTPLAIFDEKVSQEFAHNEKNVKLYENNGEDPF